MTTATTNYTPPADIVKILKTELQARPNTFEFTAAQYLIHPDINAKVAYLATGRKLGPSQATAGEVTAMLRNTFANRTAGIIQLLF